MAWRSFAGDFAAAVLIAANRLSVRFCLYSTPWLSARLARTIRCFYLKRGVNGCLLVRMGHCRMSGQGQVETYRVCSRGREAGAVQDHAYRVDKIGVRH